MTDTCWICNNRPARSWVVGQHLQVECCVACSNRLRVKLQALPEWRAYRRALALREASLALLYRGDMVLDDHFGNAAASDEAEDVWRDRCLELLDTIRADRLEP